MACMAGLCHRAKNDDMGVYWYWEVHGLYPTRVVKFEIVNYGQHNEIATLVKSKNVILLLQCLNLTFCD